MTENVAPTPTLTDPDAARAEQTSRLWHRGCTIGLAAAVVLYLVFALTSAPHALEVTFAVASFVMALAYMATTLWVFTLKTERKRAMRGPRRRGLVRFSRTDILS